MSVLITTRDRIQPMTQSERICCVTVEAEADAANPRHRILAPPQSDSPALVATDLQQETNNIAKLRNNR
ncbi:hypothetical protein BaRGS_00003052, partial [Batillaria attramentaria]